MKRTTKTAATALLVGAAMAGVIAGTVGCSTCKTDAGTKMEKKDMSKHACKGQNECKGQGGCKTDKNSCKGQNACKGQGGCSTM